MSLFKPVKNGVQVLIALGAAEANFCIVATHVRESQPGRNYLLQDGRRLEEVVEKWRFEPKSEPLSRCGYDYQLAATNGEVTLNLSICFICNTLVLDHGDKFAISPRKIQKLLSEDFDVVK